MKPTTKWIAGALAIAGVILPFRAVNDNFPANSMDKTSDAEAR